MARYSNSNRKTTPKVRDGNVQKKDRHAPTRLNSLSVGIDGSRGRQIVSKDDIWKFVRLIPNWKRVSKDLDLIYLSCVTNWDSGVDGWYGSPSWPMIVLNSWEEDLTLREFGDEYLEDHRALFGRLGAEICADENSFAYIQFDEDSARAWQLLHIFLHELGHHHYRIFHGKGTDCGDEKYAENYALKMERKIWKRYCEAFAFRPRQQAQSQNVSPEQLKRKRTAK